MADPDYATWLPKQQAADAIGVSTKTLESMAKAGQLQQAFWRRPTGGPALAVYHPGDVARLALARHPAPAPFVLPADATSPNGNGDGHGVRHPAVPESTALAVQPGDDVLRAVFAAALRAVTSQSSEKVGSKLFLTLAEASTVSGLSVSCLRRLITEEKLKAVRDRGWRIRRRDLEQL